MSIAFSGGELIDIAIGIEKQGIVYYDVMARSTKQVIVRDLFIHLAEAEREHAKTFQSMLADEKYISPEYQKHEHDDYLRALVNNTVFTDELATSELSTHVDSEIEAVEMGINVEKDSILFYYYMKEILPANITPVIEKILNEEKLHLSALSELKKKMLSMKQPG